MAWIVAHMRGIMLVSGALTCSMIYAAIDPDGALRSAFGGALEGPVAEIVVRSWGVLIALVGGMLIYGAFDMVVRPLVLVVAALSKVAYIALVLVHGRDLPGYQAGPSIAIDAVMVGLFVSYLVAVHRSRMARP